MPDNNVKWFTKCVCRFHDLSVRTDRKVAAGIEITPATGDEWTVVGTSMRGILSRDQIFEVWTNENGAQQISWQSPQGTVTQYGIVALALELQNAAR